MAERILQEVAEHLIQLHPACSVLVFTALLTGAIGGILIGFLADVF